MATEINTPLWYIVLRRKVIKAWLVKKFRVYWTRSYITTSTETQRWNLSCL